MWANEGSVKSECYTSIHEVACSGKVPCNWHDFVAKVGNMIIPVERSV